MVEDQQITDVRQVVVEGGEGAWLAGGVGKLAEVLGGQVGRLIGEVVGRLRRLEPGQQIGKQALKGGL